MIRSALRWLYFSAALFLAGPLCWRLVCLIPASDGGLAAGATLSAAPFLSILATIAAFAVAGLFGCAGARFFASERTGLFSAGLALSWTPWSIARLDDLSRSSGSFSMSALAIEGALLGLFGCGVAWLIWVCRSRSSRSYSDPRSTSLGLLGPAVALAVGAACAWAVARSNAPGQGLASGVVAALLGTLVGRVIDADATDRAFFVSAALLAVASPLLAAQGGGGGIIEQVYSGAIFPTARVMPIDWIAGALLGIPLGSAWASSMIEKRTHPALSPQS